MRGSGADRGRGGAMSAGNAGRGGGGGGKVPFSLIVFEKVANDLFYSSLNR